MVTKHCLVWNFRCPSESMGIIVTSWLILFEYSRVKREGKYTKGKIHVFYSSFTFEYILLTFHFLHISPAKFFHVVFVRTRIFWVTIIPIDSYLKWRQCLAQSSVLMILFIFYFAEAQMSLRKPMIYTKSYCAQHNQINLRNGKTKF